MALTSTGVRLRRSHVRYDYLRRDAPAARRVSWGETGKLGRAGGIGSASSGSVLSGGAMTERIPTVVIGAGQAGLATSHELTRAGVPHTVLERGRVGQTWRGLWDSFCLVTPNWTVQLPGGAYNGPEPDGFMERDAVVAHATRAGSRHRCARAWR
jgi:FAD binding domain